MPAGSTYTPLATTTLGSAASSYTFSSIPSTYTDLVLVMNGAQNIAGSSALELNGDTGTNYSYTTLEGDGSAASSFRSSNVNSSSFNLFYFDTNPSTAIVHFQNYSNSTTNKTMLCRWGGSAYVSARVGLWRSTSAVNSIKVSCGTRTFNAGSTFTLYGIASA